MFSNPIILFCYATVEPARPIFHRVSGVAFELGSGREVFSEVFDKNANFIGHSAARRPYCKDSHRSLKGSQKADDGTLAEFSIALTSRGKDLIVPAFRKHSGQMGRVFSELSREELGCLEVALKKLGKRASALMDQS
jgi:hypothetical protein